MEEHEIDVRDLDSEWFLNVRVWLDRKGDRYYFPHESIERLGEAGDERSYLLLDGAVIAEPTELTVAGTHVLAWAVPVGVLTTRPSKRG